MVTGLIDNRNKVLFDELKASFTITIELVKDTQTYSCYSINNESTIYVPESLISAEAFTHELLHIFLRSKKIFIGSRLKRKLPKCNELSGIFTETLLTHISNCLDHIKMLPLYLNLGYERDKFISDYHKYKCPIQDLELLQTAMVDVQSNNCQLTEFYLEKYFAIKACPNPAFDYTSQLKILEKLDKKLFYINERLISKWSSMSIYHDTNPEKAYIEIAEAYIHEMKMWVKHFNP